MLGAAIVLTLLFLSLNTGPEPASAATGGPEMVLNVKGGNCDDPVRPTNCSFPIGASFTLVVDALGIPAGGYDLIATALDLGTKLIYTPTAAAADEILWPDVVIATRGNIGTVLVHGGLAGLFPPLPVSTYVGNLVEISLACPLSVNDSLVTIPLLALGHPDALTSGAQFQLAGVSTVPKVSSLNIHCIAPTPTPTNTPTPTDTPTPTKTPTPTPTPTFTNTPTNTPTPTFTDTFTPTNTFTNTPTLTPSNTPTNTFTPTPTITSTPCPPEGCPTDTPTPTPTPTPTFTDTPTFTNTPTLTNTPTVTNTPTTSPTPSTSFFVNSTADNNDTNPGDGTCITLFGTCTLRAAIQEANAIPGPDVISVPVGIYVLGKGQLTITTDLSLNGADSVKTIVDGAGLDRVFEITSGATVVISDLTIRNGSANSSGGIRNSGTTTLNRTTVSGNRASNAGGGIGGGGGGGGVLTLNESTITGNSARVGGGIRNSGTLLVNNSTITGNVADNFGGGIRSTGTVTINNSTIARNFAGNNGGGIDNATIKNTIVAENSPNDCRSAVVSLGHNLDSDGSCGLASAGDISNANPVLAPLAYNIGPTLTHALLPGSPAIDAGSSDCPPPAADQRGASRGFDGDGNGQADCDIGSFECQAVGCPPPPTPTPAPDADGDGCSNQREQGLDETLGGLRDWQNPWDFYDVLGPGGSLFKDRVIDLPNDILGVIQHFAPTGLPPYDVRFDRGPATAAAGGGPNTWNMTAPDGAIDLPNDILGVILQFGHDCR